MIVVSSELEEQRLHALRALELMDTAAEPEIDELVNLAAAICGTPISLVTLVDERRLWFKAIVGVGFHETPRDISFCSHAIQRPDLFVVEDAAQDDRFRENPMVTGDPHIRFYAGMPVHSPDGFALGTLCVIDRIPRVLTESQKAALNVLARQVTARFELRGQRRALREALEEKDQMAGALRASEERFRAFMENSPFVSYLKDAEGRYLFYNRRAAAVFGAEDGVVLLGRRDADIWPKAVAEKVRDVDQTVLRTGRPIDRMERLTDRDGSVTSWRVIKFSCLDSAGGRMIAGVAVDMTESVERKLELEAYQTMLEEANNRLRYLAVTDGLTGLKNRRAFDERLLIEFSMARRRKRALSVALIDADDFKQINDRFGHAEGDAVLRQLGNVLHATVRLPDLAVRYGGEEFAVLLPETDAANARMWGARLTAALGEVKWGKTRVTISVGLATVTDDTLDGEHLVRMADEALYAAKRAGKDRIMQFGDINQAGPSTEPEAGID